jgi:antirestriction protein
MTTTETELDDVYEAWKVEQDYSDQATRERFDEAYIGFFYDLEDLGKHVAEESGSIDDFWQGKDEHHLAYYFKFDYFAYGRDLDLGGDVYSIEERKPIGTAGHSIQGWHYFWANV